MHIDELSIMWSELPNNGIDAIELGPGNARRGGKKIAGVIAESRIVNGAQQNWPYRKRLQKSIQPLLKAGDALPSVCSKTSEKIVASYCNQSDSRTGCLDTSRLPGEIVNHAAITRPWSSSAVIEAD